LGVPEHEHVERESERSELVFLAFAVGLAKFAAVAVEDDARDGVRPSWRLMCTPMQRR
jgi:hypothetical protein